MRHLLFWKIRVSICPYHDKDNDLAFYIFINILDNPILLVLHQLPSIISWSNNFGVTICQFIVFGNMSSLSPFKRPTNSPFEWIISSSYLYSFQSPTSNGFFIPQRRDTCDIRELQFPSHRFPLVNEKQKLTNAIFTIQAPAIHFSLWSNMETATMIASGAVSFQKAILLIMMLWRRTRIRDIVVHNPQLEYRNILA